jgi:ABC-2 type transport system ATP-binding protein
MAIISVQDFSKQYGDIKAVNNISFEVQHGEIYGFLGPNGAGKTTTIKVMIGRLHKYEGEISICGLSARSSIKKIHQQIGIVSEHQSLYKHLSAFSNIDFFRQLFDLAPTATHAIMERLGITELANRRIDTLSKGQRQKILLARAMLHRPSVIFLDEPTSGLDPESAREIHHLIKEMKHLGVTIFLTTHQMEEADNLCDSVAFIKAGRIIHQGAPLKLKQQLGRASLLVSYLNQNGEEQSEQLELSGELTYQRLEEIRQQGTICSIHSQEASLRDVFFSLVQNEERDG